MSTKSNDRKSHREKGTKLNCKSVQETLHDEIALRDEIYELKRQVMILRRTNEQNLVKLRKYDDEAKRKDRQIEQLMDPRKNADIAKILSTKGAAILMNLKDQNDSLIQMILNKDSQIRRLIAEIKTSKLYSASRKTEPYRAEIFRLRNLLIKSEEMLKESLDMQRKTKSICVNGNSIPETSSSSDQSSPRELDELRVTIQGLETYVKHSNDLLARKNQEILILKNELNNLKKTFQCETCKKNSENFGYDFQLEKNYLGELSTDRSQNERENHEKFEEFLPQTIKTGKNENLLELFEKTMKVIDKKNVPNSAPTSFFTRVPSNDLAPKYVSLSNLCESNENRKENLKQLNTDETSENDPQETHSTESVIKIVSMSTHTIRKSLLHDLAANEISKEKEMLSPETEPKITNRGRELWKKALILYNESKSQDCEMTMKTAQNLQKPSNDLLEEKSKKFEESPKIETDKFQKTEKSTEREAQTQKYHESGESEKMKYSKKKQQSMNLENERSKVTDTESQEDFHSASLCGDETEESLENTTTAGIALTCASVNLVPIITNQSKVPTKENTSQHEVNHSNTQIGGCNINKEESNSCLQKTCQSPEEKFTDKTLTSNNTISGSDRDTSSIKREIYNIASTFSPEIQRELKNLYENISSYEEIENGKTKFFREIHQQSFDSSSENSYTTKREAQIVQVKAEINSIPVQDDSYQSQGSKTEQLGGNGQFHYFQDDDFNDDDDVIFC